MKKMIYAVKSGRKTGIFNEWPKCSEQTNKYPNAKFRRFEYRSDLENDPEDVPGSLRYAIKEAESYLRDLVYLGKSADYLEDAGWAEDGFLPFGNEQEAENPELFSDKRTDDEEDIRDIDEEYDKWLAGIKNSRYAPGESWKTAGEAKYRRIAEDMKKCVHIISFSKNDSERENAADSLRKNLIKCVLDENLKDLTAVYRNKQEKNAIGYNPPAVARFVRMLAHRYPKL